LEIFPKLKPELIHRYEFRVVFYMSDVIKLDLTCEVKNIESVGIRDKCTIVITSPNDLRALQERPVFDDDDGDDNEAKDDYSELTNEGVLKKLLEGFEPKEESLLLRYFEIYAEGMMKMDKFVDLPRSSIFKIVKRKRLNIEEKKLFLALVAWGRAELKRNNVVDNPSNLRDTLEAELKYIRFPLIPEQDLSLIVLPTQLLSLQELLKLYRYLGAEPEEREKLQVPWQTEPRNARRPPNTFHWQFDSERKHPAIKLSKDGRTVETLPQAGWQSIFGNRLLPLKGIFTWYITLDQYDVENTWNIAIGVVSAEFTNWEHTSLCGYDDSSTGWTFIVGNGKKCCNCAPFGYEVGQKVYDEDEEKQYNTMDNLGELLGESKVNIKSKIEQDKGDQGWGLSTEVKQGDTIGVRVNMDDGKITFIHNGDNLGVAFWDLPKELRPCLSLVNQQKISLNFPIG